MIRVVTLILLWNIVAVVSGEKGETSFHQDDIMMSDIRDIHRLLRRRKANPLTYHAIVAEEVIPGRGSNRHWKGTGYGYEKGWKGKGKSSKSSKDSKSEKSPKSKCSPGKGKGKGSSSSDDYDDACSESPSLSPSAAAKPSSSPTVSAKPSISSAPTGMNTSPSNNFTSSMPSIVPSSSPSSLPTAAPSTLPVSSPSSLPTAAPSTLPASRPSSLPTLAPSSLPASSPSSLPTSIPSSFPTMEFDLQVCASYSRRWLLDLAESCDELFRNCQCPSAKFLIDNGRIDCEVERCPPGCAVCSFCLEDVLFCYDSSQPPQPISVSTSAPSQRPSNESPSKMPSVSPSAIPSASPTKEPSDNPTDIPSIVPSVQPTHKPSQVPSSNPSETPTTSQSPTSAFDLATCNTYAPQWLKDLDDTCAGDPALNAESCQCLDARARIESGEIRCGSAQCPDDCEVCKFCLYEVEGCPWIDPPSSSPSVVKSDSPSVVPTSSPSVQKSEKPSSVNITASPTKQPSNLFDLSNCDAYSGPWRFELIVNGKCVSAENLVREGRITCASECPVDCTMCNFCLGQLLDCDAVTDAPSPGPSVGFNLDKCDSYSDRWLREVIELGRCEEAIQLEANGEISCNEDDCPVDCPVCHVCLSQIPCSNPSTPTLSPRNSTPTNSPKPTTIASIAPSVTFNISDCHSYSKRWLFDLHETCGDLEGLDYTTAKTSCKAIDAEKKIANGFITCGVDVCPEDCAVCQFSLYELLGCLPTQTRAKRTASG